MAALVGDKRNESSILSDAEYKILKNALRFARSEDEEADAIAYALKACTEERCAQPEGVFGYFFHALLSSYGEHVEEFKGMLVESGEKPVFIREDEGPGDRLAVLNAFLKLLRTGGWLGYCLDCSVEAWAKKLPTPLEVLRQITGEAETFESALHQAKQIIRDWPSLLGLPDAGESATGEGYVLNAYDSTGNLDKAIWMSKGQYRDVKETLLKQGCEVVDGSETPKAKAATE